MPEPAEASAVQMPFGKHKGKTLAEIADEDVLYLDWLRGLVDLREPLKSAVDTMCRRYSREIANAIAALRSELVQAFCVAAGGVPEGPWRYQVQIVVLEADQAVDLILKDYLAAGPVNLEMIGRWKLEDEDLLRKFQEAATALAHRIYG